jgi:hypothetical protein
MWYSYRSACLLSISSAVLTFSDAMDHEVNTITGPDSISGQSV